ncbi:MAG: GtrA family protein [Candidatus Nealsonbacteria bacterium]
MKKVDILASLIIGFVCGLILPHVELFAGVFPEQILRYFPILLPVLSLLGVWVLETVFKKTLTLVQFGKSFLVGILNSSIDMGVFDCLTWFFSIASGWMPVLFKTVSFGCGAVNSYFWNKFWTFQKRDTQDKTKEAVQFFLVTFGGLLIHTTVIYVMVNIIGVKFGVSERMWASIGNMIAIFTGFVWNFLGYKFLVFKK